MIAYNCALKSADDLYVKTEESSGFYAGLPWFFQFWTRDEAISLKSIIIKGRYEPAKSILLERIKEVYSDGRVRNCFPLCDLGTADGAGWVFRRLYDLVLKIKEEEKDIERFIKKEELMFIRQQLKKSIEGHMKYHYEDSLIKNN